MLPATEYRIDTKRDLRAESLFRACLLHLPQIFNKPFDIIAHPVIKATTKLR